MARRLGPGSQFPALNLDSPRSCHHSSVVKALPRLISTGIMLAAAGACTPGAESDPPPIPETSARSPANPPAPDKPAERKPKTAEIREIDITQLFTLRTDGKALIYDVRLPLYYKLGHIDGAILFYPKPFDEAFEREQPRMEKAIREGKAIILYCGGIDCNDSHIVAKMIAERGIAVSVYSGGWAEWKEVGME